MSRWHDWYKQYRATLKPLEMEELGDLVFCRPPAFLLAKALRATPITPDHVSFFAVIWSVVVSYCFWQGSYRYTLMAAAAFYFWNVLDCVDGQLARMKGGGSPIGYIVDEVVDQISTVLLWLGIAGGLAHGRGGEHNWWLMGVVGGVCMGIECSVLEAKCHEWQVRVYGSRKSFRDDLAQVTKLGAEWRREGRHLVGRFVIRFYQVQRWLQGLYLPGTEREEPQYTKQQNERWAKVHRKVLRMAVWLGPTTQMFVTIACCAVNRMDYYLWAVLFVGLPWMVLVHLMSWYARHQEQHQKLQET